MLLPILLLSLLSLVAPAPSPQDPNDDVEVLSSGPVRVRGDTADYPDFADYGSSGFPSLGDFPILGGFPSIFGRGFGGGRPRVRVLVIPLERGQGDQGDQGGRTSSFGDILTSLFGRGPPRASPRQEPVSDREECGPLCTLLATLWDSHVKDVRDQVDSVRDRQNELDSEDFLGKVDGEFDTNNSTHMTKVLDDGSVLHINKTTIADTDLEGNTFFFHKSVVSTVREAAPEEEEAEEDFGTEEEED